MRNAYLQKLYELAAKDRNVLALISDNGAIVYDKYRESFPNQYMNFGIAEANMIAAAAGMTTRNKIPFAYTIGAFLAYRAIEFIRNDVCYQNRNVKIVGIGSGCVYGNLGPTHHATEDISILRSMPNLTIFCPASPLESQKVTQSAYEINGPVYIRLGRNNEPEIYEKDYTFVPGRAIDLKTGKDITLVGTGTTVYDLLRAVELLNQKGLSAGVINIHTIKPFDEEIILKAAEETGKILTVEEHSIYGGLGSAVAETLAEHNCNVQFARMGLKDFAHGYGTYNEIKKMNGLDIESIVRKSETFF